MKINCIKFLTTTLFIVTGHLLVAQELKLTFPMGNTSLVNGRFSADGKWIVTAGSPGAKVWNTESGKLIYSLEGDNNAAFSPDGKWIAATSSNGPISLWNFRTGKPSHSFESARVQTLGLKEIVFSPDGKWLLTVCEDNSARIWEIETGEIHRTFKGHTERLYFARFGVDGSVVVTGSSDKIIVWDIKSGTPVREFKGGSIAEFSPDNAQFITSWGSYINVWELSSGRMIKELRLPRGRYFEYVTYCPDGKYLAAVSARDTIRRLMVYNTTTWDSAYTKPIKFNSWTPRRVMEFSPDGKIISIFLGSTVQFLETITGRSVKILETGDNLVGYDQVLDSSIRIEAARVNSTTFSPNGDRMIVGKYTGGALWDIRSGKNLYSFNGVTPRSEAALSEDGKRIIFTGMSARLLDIQSGKFTSLKQIGPLNYCLGGRWITQIKENSIHLFDIPSGNLLTKLPVYGDIEYEIDPRRIVINPRISKYGPKSSTKVFDLPSGKQVYSRDHREDILNFSYLSPDGQLTGSTISKYQGISWASIYSVQSGQRVSTLFDSASVRSISFSPDNKTVLVDPWKGPVMIFETKSGKKMFSLVDQEVKDPYASGKFTPDGKWIVTSHGDKTARVWNAKDGKLVSRIPTHNNRVQLSKDGKLLITFGSDNKVELLELPGGKLIHSFDHESRAVFMNENKTWILMEGPSGATLKNLETDLSLTVILIGDDDWLITHPSGLFDATPGAMDKLYFTFGPDVIDFNQLKERYYEPGLWKKAINGEPLRNVSTMKSIELPPDLITSEMDDQGYLRVNLVNRGGGIGEVNVFINGKEAIKDARDQNEKGNGASLALKVFIGNHKSIIKGHENLIVVKAWNTGHWVVSRGKLVTYKPGGGESYKPAIHILSCGVSDYTGNEIDLKYAAKDATSMSNALKMGARELFGIERSYVYNLTTDQAPNFNPTKANILRAIDQIVSKSHPLDVFVMYLSGHGINIGGQDGDWYYLTQNAYTSNASAYNDPAIRQETTISSNELVEQFKKVSALKQVLIIDACASGKVVENLMTQKDISSSTLRALDRMRDRTGMHIITGCAADAVSFEASKYGQGVLTYSLLEGIRGAALREDKFVDVNKLFQYAQERVPLLAEGIGGIQSPQIFSPQGSQSFDIGLLTETDKKEIPIELTKQVYIRSNFQDEKELEDVLGLSKQLNEALNDVSSKGINSKLIFVDVSEYPEGCKLIGRYTQTPGQIKVKLRKKCSGADQNIELSGISVEALVKKILAVL